MRRLVVALAAVLLGQLLTGCADDATIPRPDPVHTEQPAPDLVRIKKDAGIRDCQPGTATDSKLPDLKLGCLGGGTVVNLNTLGGPMIINIWRSSCEFCKDEMPALQEFDQDYGDRVPVIGIDTLDTQPEAALDLAQSTGVTYPLLSDPIGETSANDPFPRYIGYPYVLFVDAEGDITHYEIGGVDSVDELVDLTREHLGVDL